MFVSGMGFFTDAYDLFVIGIVVALLKTQWPLSTGQVSLAELRHPAGVGGRRDRLRPGCRHPGPQAIYGYEVLILAVGAIASAFSPNYTFLLVCRIVLGIGIGGDYPVSATIMSEYSGKKSRGKMVGLVFAMQGAGLIVGPLIASILLASGLSDNLAWRMLLGLGAIPGLAVFYLRRQIHETPRFAMAGGAHDEAAGRHRARHRRQARGAGPAAESTRGTRRASPRASRLLQNRRMLIWLIGTAGAWMLLDFCYYGNTISQPEILKLLNPNATCWTTR